MKALASLSIVLALAGCGSMETAEGPFGPGLNERGVPYGGPRRVATDSVPAAASQAAPHAAPAADGAKLATGEAPIVKPLQSLDLTAAPLEPPVAVPAELLAQRSVYYETDTYVVAEAYEPMIEAHAAWLREHGDVRVRVEGNCDERGSREYNLALGQRRADAVRRRLVLLGVAPEQIETVTLGAEKPKVFGSDAAAWAENRRTDLHYAGAASAAPKPAADIVVSRASER